jgi:NADH dehydrogenase
VLDADGPILVTGANGQLGRRLIQRLAEAEPPGRVRALVRSQRAADSLADIADPAQAEVRIVEYADTAGITQAARGAATAVHLLGILKETRSNRYVDAHERPAEALAAAADAAGLRRIVLVSILGSRPDAANPCLASKGRAEAILLAAKTPCSVIRVPMVLGAGDPASQALRRQAEAGSVTLVRGGATLEQPIAADDVVAGIIAALARTGDDDLALDLAGPCGFARCPRSRRVHSRPSRSGCSASLPSRARCSACSSTTTPSIRSPPPRRSGSA